MNLSPSQRSGKQLPLAEVARRFIQVALDARDITLVDAVEPGAGCIGFRIRACDAHGPLPEIVVAEESDRLRTQSNVDREACKLVAVSRIRSNLMGYLPGSHFLPPTTFEGKAIVGMQVGDKTFHAEGSSFLEAYYKLKRKTLAD